MPRKARLGAKQYKHESCDFRVLRTCEIGKQRVLSKREDDNESFFFSVVVDPAVKIIKFDVVNVELKA